MLRPRHAGRVPPGGAPRELSIPACCLPSLPQRAPAFLETQQGTAPRVAEHPQSPSEGGLLDGPHPHPPGQEPLRLWSFGGVFSVPGTCGSGVRTGTLSHSQVTLSRISQTFRFCNCSPPRPRLGKDVCLLLFLTCRPFNLEAPRGQVCKQGQVLPIQPGGGPPAAAAQEEDLPGPWV